MCRTRDIFGPFSHGRMIIPRTISAALATWGNFCVGPDDNTGFLGCIKDSGLISITIKSAATTAYCQPHIEYEDS